MFIKKSLIIISITLFFNVFAFSVSAQEATSTSSGQATSTLEIIPEIATSTPETIPEIVLTPPTEEPATSTPPVEPVPEPAPLPPPAIEPVTVPIPESSPPPVEPAPQPPPPPPVEPAPQPTPTPPPPSPAIDPATAPSKVTIRVIMSDGSLPPFPVFVTFVGVGNKNFGGKISENGELKIVMPTGRYYTELLVINTDYVQGEDGPSFFLEANEERDLGVIRLKLKSEMTSQSLEDKTLEDNILAEAGSVKGIGKILVLIVKLLIKILEEIRAIAQKL